MSKCDSNTLCEACNGDDRFPHKGRILNTQDGTLLQTPLGMFTCHKHKHYGTQPCWHCKKESLDAHEATASDVVKSPSHYQFFPGVEAIEIIAASMSEEGFHGYCMGNRLKYRLRAGNKDKLEQDISKSDFYVELFNKHKHLCKVTK